MGKSLSARQKAELDKLPRVFKEAWESSRAGKIPLRDERYNIGFYKGRRRAAKDDVLASKQKESVLVLFNRLKQLSAGHVPTPNKEAYGQWVAVEIECFINRGAPQSVVSKFIERLVELDVKRVQVKGDGSLGSDDPDDVPIEICVLFNLKTGFQDLARVCQALREFNGSVNKTCGLHVHLDARQHLIARPNLAFTRTDQLKQRRAILRMSGYLVRCLPFLVAMQPESRRSNSYCRYGRSERGDRYYMINTLAFQQHKTIEVRLGAGSTNFQKISCWIRLLARIVEMKPQRAPTTFQEFIDVMQLDDSLTAYCEERITEFNGASFVSPNFTLTESAIRSNRGA